ncbi:MAG: hypothetical protein ABIF82_03300 [Planctomycetota bacterium]
MPDFDLHLFTDVGKSYRPRATLRNNGQIGFNSAAVAKFELKEYTYAQLLYDPAQRVIAVRFHSQEPDQGALKVTRKETNFAVAARALLDCYDIAYGGARKSRTFELKKLESEPSTFYFELGSDHEGEERG